jgi:hypothetical protein
MNDSPKRYMQFWPFHNHMMTLANMFRQYWSEIGMIEMAE